MSVLCPSRHPRHSALLYNCYSITNVNGGEGHLRPSGKVRAWLVFSLPAALLSLLFFLWGFSWFNETLQTQDWSSGLSLSCLPPSGTIVMAPLEQLGKLRGVGEGRLLGETGAS